MKSESLGESPGNWYFSEVPQVTPACVQDENPCTQSRCLRRRVSGLTPCAQGGVGRRSLSKVTQQKGRGLERVEVVEQGTVLS